MNLKSDYRTASGDAARDMLHQEWDRVLNRLRNRDDLFSGATVPEIAQACEWSTEHTKIVLWNMLDRNLIRREGSCMDESLFYPVN